jgi:hypothetical protein
VSAEYTPEQQMGRLANTLTAIFDNIRVAKANREIQQLRLRAEANAQALLKMREGGIAAHLDTTQPIAPNAIRVGVVFLHVTHTPPVCDHQSDCGDNRYRFKEGSFRHL